MIEYPYELIEMHVSQRRINRVIENFELANHINFLPMILKQNQLDWVLTLVNKTNIAANVPYHNKNHTYCVMLNCYEGAFWEKSYHTKLLLVAAAFHDFNHSAGLHDDSVNIAYAVDSLHKYASSHLSACELREVTRIIESTHYPYLHNPRSLEEKIIRDSDIMQIYEPVDKNLYQIYNGLRQEMGLKNPLTISQFLEKSEQFFAKHVWHTEWAKKKSQFHNWEETQTRLFNVMLEHK